MATVVPTIFTADPQEYRSLITSFNAFTKHIHVDITDGDFVPARTIQAATALCPQNWRVDFHMMVSYPSQYIPILLKLKPSLVIFHAEVKEKLAPTLEQLKAAGIKTGIALLKGTYPGNLKTIISSVDHVLIFAGEIGKQGSTADMLQIEKAPIIRSIKKDVEIGWDGGANLSNIRAIAHADIDVINVGSAICKAPGHATTYKALVEEADRRGVLLT